jgi:hypothetical protein
MAPGVTNELGKTGTKGPAAAKEWGHKTNSNKINKLILKRTVEVFRKIPETSTA